MYQKLGNTEKIAYRIKTAMQAKGLSYGDLAEMIGTTRQYLSVMLSGVRPLTPDKIMSLAEILELSLDYVIYGTKNIIRLYPSIEDELTFSSALLMTDPINDILIPAKNHGYEHINGISEDDLIVIQREKCIDQIPNGKIVVAAIDQSPASLYRFSIGQIPVFYSDNGEPPIASTNFKIFGFAKRIFKDI